MLLFLEAISSKVTPNPPLSLSNKGRENTFLQIRVSSEIKYATGQVECNYESHSRCEILCATPAEKFAR
jgi:hypothetical protein